MRRYTLTECYELLDVDPKTFRGWLMRAGIEPTTSKADPRVKYLTEEQLQFLAREHERTPDAAKHQREVIPATAYKLQQERVDGLERQLAQLSSSQQQGHEETAQALEQARVHLDEWVTQLSLQIEAVRSLSDSLAASFPTFVGEQAQRLDQVRAEQAASREDLRLIREHSETAQAKPLQAVEELHRTMAASLRQAMEAMARESQTRAEQQANALSDALRDRNQEVAANLVLVTGRLDHLERRVEMLATQAEALRDTIQGWQRRADAQDQAITAQQALLTQEKEARQALAAHLAELAASITGKASAARPLRKAGERGAQRPANAHRAT